MLQIDERNWPIILTNNYYKPTSYEIITKQIAAYNLTHYSNANNDHPQSNQYQQTKNQTHQHNNEDDHDNITISLCNEKSRYTDRTGVFELMYENELNKVESELTYF